MVKCDKCPCLQMGKSFDDWYDVYNDRRWSLREWWFCGVDESDIAEGNVSRRDVKVKECPISRIELKDGTVYEPEVISEPEVIVGM